MQYANPPQPTVTFFPAVLKTLSNPFPATRPLVYNYLLHHAESDPDTALLSINTIQKSLSDSNPRIRAMALKTMSGIRVPVISQIVSLAIKKGASDLSPIVRKTAALACIKCVRLDPTTRPQIEEYLAALLRDKQYYVAGAAVQAFAAVCPDRMDMIHPVYRRLCKMVVDMDEWGQLALIRLITFYARRNFPQKTQRVRRAATQEQRSRDFYEDLEKESEDQGDTEEVDVVDPDLELFLKSIAPLLSSRNAAVIVAVTRSYLYLSPNKHLSKAIDPLIALLRAPEDIQQVALHDIVQVCLHNPSHFARHFRHFLIRSHEAPEIWRLKLETLTLVFPHCDKDVQDMLLAELEHFSKCHDPQLVRESVRAIGRCAQSSSASSNSIASRRCLTLLLKQIHSTDQNLVGEAMEVIRHLIQRSPSEHKKTVIRLAKNLDSLTSSTARASIIWLIGEFASGTDDSEDAVAADVLRILVKGYADESDEVRAQIILLAAKTYLHHQNRQNEKKRALGALKSTESTTLEDDVRDASPDSPSHSIELLYNYTLLLARYTPSYDLRDRARVYRALLAVPASTELASLLLLAPKPFPQAPSPSESRKNFVLGSSSLVIGGEEAGSAGVSGYENLPAWVEEGDEPDPKLREDLDSSRGVEYGQEKIVSAGRRLDEALSQDPGYTSTAAAGKGKSKEKSLDAWLDEEDDEEDEEEEEDDEEDESDDEEESSESHEDDDDSEEETESEEDEDEEDERAGLVHR
jgi:vesicle coat complex subunit